MRIIPAKWKMQAFCTGRNRFIVLMTDERGLDVELFEVVEGSVYINTDNAPDPHFRYSFPCKSDKVPPIARAAIRAFCQLSHDERSELLSANGWQLQLLRGARS